MNVGVRDCEGDLDDVPLTVMLVDGDFDAVGSTLYDELGDRLLE